MPLSLGEISPGFLNVALSGRTNSNYVQFDQSSTSCKPFRWCEGCGVEQRGNYALSAIAAMNPPLPKIQASWTPSSELFYLHTSVRNRLNVIRNSWFKHNPSLMGDASSLEARNVMCTLDWPLEYHFGCSSEFAVAIRRCSTPSRKISLVTYG